MSLVWRRCRPSPSGVRNTAGKVNLLGRFPEACSAVFIRHGHPAFTDEEFALRQKAMGKFRVRNTDWMKKKIQNAIPTIDLGIMTAKTEGLPEYSDEPEYPPIFEYSPAGLKRYKRDQWIRKLREYPTVEEKMFWMNERRYYGFKTFMMEPLHEPYGSLDFLKHCTRTQLIHGLPDYLEDDHLQQVSQRYLPSVKEAILTRSKFSLSSVDLESSGDPLEAKATRMSAAIQNVVDSLVQEMSGAAECEHLKDASVDLKPRIEASWFCGGFYPHRLLRKQREGLSDDREKILEKVSYPFQIICDTSAQVRTENPLPPVVEFSDPLVENTIEKEVDWSFYPQCFQLPLKLRFGTSIPGFWPSDPCEFGLVSFTPRTFIDESSKYCFDGLYNVREALDQRGIKAGFAWTFAQATYQGFECYNDITYPLVSQCVITDGQKFSFYVYQLNTTKLHDEFATENPKWNLCWGSEEMSLFESVDADGNLVGVNDAVIQLLIKFMAKQPRARTGADAVLKPYLGPEKYVQNLPAGEYKDFIAEGFKYLASNRPRSVPRPEIHAWEKIYKVDFFSRPRDGRKRFFELNRNPNPSFEERLKDFFRR